VTLLKLKKLATGWQKPRHASLIAAGAGTLPRFGFTAPTSIRSATFTAFIAGPLAFRPGATTGTIYSLHDSSVMMTNGPKY